MKFKQHQNKNSLVIGFVVSYFIFTTILYFILKLADKLPENWNYFYIIMITLIIILTGKLLQLWLR